MIETNIRDRIMTSFLVDHGGLERVEGYIRSIDTAVPLPFLELENGMRILVKDIVAINGTFLSAYSEC